jgi:hypothetical protein
MCRMLWVILAVFAFLMALPLSQASDPGSPAEDESILQATGVAPDGESLLAFFRSRIPSAADRERLQDLLRRLGDDEFATRNQAAKDLATLGPAFVGPLREALQGETDIEVVRRVESWLRDTEKVPEGRLASAAARVAGRLRPAGLAAALLDYLPSAPDDDALQEVRSALAAVAFRDGEHEPVLVRALEDSLALRRGSAAEALILAGPTPHHRARRLCARDPDPTVRLWVACALADRGDRNAVPVLIALLTGLRPDQAWRAEQPLCRLARDQTPSPPRSYDLAAWRAYRNAWAAWWEKEGQAVDLAHLHEPLGCTLAVFERSGFVGGLCVGEYDRDSKPRWKWNGRDLLTRGAEISMPRDVQVLPGGRVLVAEYVGRGHNGRVTERDRTGQVVWEWRVPPGDADVKACRRLDNGHTLIATPEHLVELDRADARVFSWRPSERSRIVGARKFPDGQYALLLERGEFVRLDATGKDVASFAVADATQLSCPNGVPPGFDVLPGGGVVVPLEDRNTVTMYDAEGRRVWQAAVERPQSAVRLPSGHTLVASTKTVADPNLQAIEALFNSNRSSTGYVVELDRQGRVVREQKLGDSYRIWRVDWR